MHGIPHHRLSPAALLALGLLAMPAAGCVITEAPQFQVPQHTRPFLVASTAFPDLREVVQINSAGTFSQQFSADVISQDDQPGTGQFTKVDAYLYVDYGVATGGAPFLWPIPGSELTAGTLDQTSGRKVSVTWSSPPYSVPAGCHTATLVVSHDFDFRTQCPVCSDDYSTLTWTVLACDPSQPSTCADLPLTGTGVCRPLTTNCESVEANAGVVCPEPINPGTTAADAGAS